jgi:L-asparaginase
VTVDSRPRIAVFAGPTATILSTHPLITSDKAIAKYGLTPRPGQDAVRGTSGLRAQRLARPVTVYIEQFSAHPLEGDVAELYAPPDGYIGNDGVFRVARQSSDDTPAYEVTLDPADGFYLLPYMARQKDGSAWVGDGPFRGAPAEFSRQGFLPDASRLVEEIDRFELDDSGFEPDLESRAEFLFYRPLPSGGYTKGLAGRARTDVGTADIEPEQAGRDFFPYRPVRHEPPPEKLASLTNSVQDVLSSGTVAGGVWIEGSPYVEETAYWLHLLLDIDVPLVCTAGNIGAPGRRNIIDAVNYVCSGIALDVDGRDRVGVVGVMDELVISARELQKGDKRPGGFIAAGSHGGVVGNVGGPGPAMLTFIPARRHTSNSEVRITSLPRSVQGWARGEGGTLEPVTVDVTDQDGRLLSGAIPRVSIVKHARYREEADDRARIVEVDGRVELDLDRYPLAGFVAEGGTPYGQMGGDIDRALKKAVLQGMPVVKVARGNADGFVPATLTPFAIGGGNLTATKARLLLMACLLKFGALPAVRDLERPTMKELSAIESKLGQYQEVFDTH